MEEKNPAVVAAAVLVTVLFIAFGISKSFEFSDASSDSPAVGQKLEQSISEQLDSEEKINVIIYFYSGQTPNMAKELQRLGAENVKMAESGDVKDSAGIVAMNSEPLYITATIKNKDAAKIAELPWVRRVVTDRLAVSQ